MWRLTSVNELAPRHHGADTSSNKRMKIVFLLLIIEQMCTCQYSGVGSNQPAHSMSSLASLFCSHKERFKSVRKRNAEPYWIYCWEVMIMI